MHHHIFCHPRGFWSKIPENPRLAPALFTPLWRQCRYSYIMIVIYILYISKSIRAKSCIKSILRYWDISIIQISLADLTFAGHDIDLMGIKYFISILTYIWFGPMCLKWKLSQSTIHIPIVKLTFCCCYKFGLQSCCQFQLINHNEWKKEIQLENFE